MDQRVDDALHLLRTTCARLHAPYDDETHVARRSEVTATVAMSRSVLLPLLEELAAERVAALPHGAVSDHIARSLMRDMTRLRQLESELRTSAEAWYAAPTSAVTASLRRTMYRLNAVAAVIVVRERTVLGPLVAAPA